MHLPDPLAEAVHRRAPALRRQVASDSPEKPEGGAGEKHYVRKRVEAGRDDFPRGAVFDHFPLKSELLEDPRVRRFIERNGPGRYRITTRRGTAGYVEIEPSEVDALRVPELLRAVPRLEGEVEDLRAEADRLRGAVASAALYLQIGLPAPAIEELRRAGAPADPSAPPLHLARVLAEQEARDTALDALSSGSRRALDRLTDAIAQIVAAADDGPRLRALVAVIVGEMPEIRERAERIREERAAASGEGLADL